MSDILAVINDNEKVIGYLTEINENSFAYRDRETLERDVSWGRYNGYNVIDGRVQRVDRYLAKNGLYKKKYRKPVLFQRHDIPFFTFSWEQLDTGIINISVSRAFCSGNNDYYLDCLVVSTEEVAVLDMLFSLQQDMLGIVTKVYDYGFRCRFSIQKLVDMETKGYTFYVNTDAIKYREQRVIDMKDKEVAFTIAFSEWAETHNSGVKN